MRGKNLEVNTLTYNIARILTLISCIYLPVGCAGKDKKLNNPPQIGNFPIKVQIEENKPFSLHIPFSDSDGDSVAVRKITGPSNVYISGDQLSFTPGDFQVGKHNVEIEASDGRGGTDRKSLELEVLDDFSDSPEITSTPKSLATEGNNYSDKISARDPDTGDSLVFRLNNNTDQSAINSGLSIDINSGLLTWNNLPLGTYHIEVEAEDTTGRKVQKGFDLKIVEPRYSLRGRIIDMNKSPLANLNVKINSSSLIITDSDGNYSFRNILKGSYTLEVDDSLNRIYKRNKPVVVKGDLTEDLVMLRLGTVSSSSTAYLNNAGLADFLIFFRHLTGTHPNSILYSINQTTNTQRWTNLPVPIFLNESFNSNSAEQRDPARDVLSFNSATGNLDISYNMTNDLVDILRQGIYVWEKETGLNLFNESATPVGLDDVNYHEEGIFVNYPDMNNGTILSASSPLNSRQYTELRIGNHLVDDQFRATALQGLGRVLGLGFDEGHSGYILIPDTLSTNLIKPHQDEVAVLKALYALSQGTDMEEFEIR